MRALPSSCWFPVHRVASSYAVPIRRDTFWPSLPIDKTLNLNPGLRYRFFFASLSGTKPYCSHICFCARRFTLTFYLGGPGSHPRVAAPQIISLTVIGWILDSWPPLGI